MIDTRRAIETPEGVELGLRVAGPIPRAYAWLVDLFIRIGIYVVLAIALTVLGRLGWGIFLILSFLLEWFYPVFFELYKHGATPGKKALGIKVVHDDGTEVNFQSSLIRNLLRAVDFLPFFYGFGLVSMLCNREFKRLGDLAGGTIVVYQDKLGQATTIPDEAPKTPPIPLTATEQKAIIQYAERLNLFTPQRGSELANTISHVTQEKDAQGVKRLVQYANWMVGRR